jgi:hypothetical protein
MENFLANFLEPFWEIGELFQRTFIWKIWCKICRKIQFKKSKIRNLEKISISQKILKCPTKQSTLKSSNKSKKNGRLTWRTVCVSSAFYISK